MDRRPERNRVRHAMRGFQINLAQLTTTPAPTIVPPPPASWQGAPRARFQVGSESRMSPLRAGLGSVRLGWSIACVVSTKSCLIFQHWLHVPLENISVAAICRGWVVLPILDVNETGPYSAS